MCGRATLTHSPEDIAHELGLDEIPTLEPRFNIAPSQPAPIVKVGTRHLDLVKWGPRINTKGDHLKAPRRRALFVVDGFYEWSGEGKARRPNHFHTREHGLLTLAALFDEIGCSMITRPAEGLVQTIHDRMPVILDPTLRSIWLDPSSTPEQLQAALRGPVPELIMQPVSRYVNSPKNEGPHCYDPPEQVELIG
jgi:putative SOS response-associated peptidase YedK